MQDIVNKIRERAKTQTKKIILPEYDDSRITDAARIIEKEGIAQILLLSPEVMDKQKIEKYAQVFFALRKSKGISLDKAFEIISDPIYYAAMMVRDGSADGFVAGAYYATPDVARAAIRCIGVDRRASVASSCFIMILPESTWGEKGVFIFADCGIVPQPNSRQLAAIAISAADLTTRVLEIEPRIAMLSYLTKGNSEDENVLKVREATKLVRQMRPDLLVDGELQADAAIVPDVAKVKHAATILKGRANILIFPDLDSGNISYKLVHRLANARAIGPILLGLNRPCSDLSRGCSVDDVIDCVAVTAIRAQST